jgi:hypothetical protein
MSVAPAGGEQHDHAMDKFAGQQWFIDSQRYALSAKGWRYGHHSGRHAGADSNES